MSCCNGYTRSQALRAVAGQGLPAVEPGMPLPAGTGMDRRAFLLRSAGLALSVYGAGRLAPAALEEGVALAAEGGPAPVLVSIFLSGGIDGLSVLAPYQDPRYVALRSSLRVTNGTPLTEDPRLVWHPAAEALRGLYDAGKVSVIPAMGYTSPNQSHFTSRHFWEVGSLEVQARTGWLGRYLDRVGEPNNAIQGLSLEGQLSPTLATSNVAVAATSSITEYTFDSPGVWDDRMVASMLDSLGRLGTLQASNPILGQARQATANAAILRAQLASLPADSGTVAYPDSGVAERLQSLARMLSAGLPIRCATLDAAGGYDTHSGQAAPFVSGLRATAEAVAAFQADLEARGLADRVLVHLWSEFGRRPEENGSAGTDHGAAGVGFLVGARAAGKLVGEFPGLGTLDPQGNVRATTDFRALYCSLLEDWLGTEAEGIIPGASSFGRYAVVR
ncbi:MAG TPA: DUF1501 domain-containing protein [Solirubrobacteraceae bacterium]|jgi:uncharacterized protein (DUF1501 family)|nr:DUF1501 domain-containing protein [Solirubrobacteraceae bacterium]